MDTDETLGLESFNDESHGYKAKTNYLIVCITLLWGLFNVSSCMDQEKLLREQHHMLETTTSLDMKMVLKATSPSVSFANEIVRNLGAQLIPLLLCLRLFYKRKKIEAGVYVKAYVDWVRQYAIVFIVTSIVLTAVHLANVSSVI